MKHFTDSCRIEKIREPIISDVNTLWCTYDKKRIVYDSYGKPEGEPRKPSRGDTYRSPSIDKDTNILPICDSDVPSGPLGEVSFCPNQGDLGSHIALIREPIISDVNTLWCTYGGYDGRLVYRDSFGKPIRDEPSRKDRVSYGPNPYDNNSDPTPCQDSGPSPEPSGGASFCPNQGDLGGYMAVDTNKYFQLLNLFKNSREMSVENILQIGSLIDARKSSRVRSTEVCLISREGIDKEVVFPDESNVGSHLVNLCDYVNDNPDNLDRVELAAAFAYGFCMVHPFVDGNGRTSRLMANHFLKEGEFFRPLPTDKEDYRKACFEINLTGDLNSMYDYFHERLSEGLQ